MLEFCSAGGVGGAFELVGEGLEKEEDELDVVVKAIDEVVEDEELVVIVVEGATVLLVVGGGRDVEAVIVAEVALDGGGGPGLVTTTTCPNAIAKKIEDASIEKFSESRFSSWIVDDVGDGSHQTRILLAKMFQKKF